MHLNQVEARLSLELSMSADHKFEDDFVGILR